jgi:hypothetical protein
MRQYSYIAPIKVCCAFFPCYETKYHTLFIVIDEPSPGLGYYYAVEMSSEDIKVWYNRSEKLLKIYFDPTKFPPYDEIIAHIASYNSEDFVGNKSKFSHIVAELRSKKSNTNLTSV